LKVLPVRAIRAVVHGRVQGVFFRAYTRDKAYQLNLVGWVRNKRDGTVECQAQGSGQAINAFIEFLHEGSPSSHVNDVVVLDVPFDPNLRDFKITY
jgi:acylphosphatase